jgi:hypothetical protein
MRGAQSLARAFDAERIGPFDFVGGVTEATLPVSGNLSTPIGPVTAIAPLYEGTGHVFVGYNTSDQVFDAPIIPPLHDLAEPRILTNPTTEAHLEIRQFFESRLMAGRARL